MNYVIIMYGIETNCELSGDKVKIDILETYKQMRDIEKKILDYFEGRLDEKSKLELLKAIKKDDQTNRGTGPH